MTYFRNENQNGSFNEELSNKGELKNPRVVFLVSSDADICSQEQEGICPFNLLLNENVLLLNINQHVLWCKLSGTPKLFSGLEKHIFF